MTQRRCTQACRLIQIVLAATGAFGQVPVRPTDGSVGSIEFHTVDGFGHPIPPSAVTRLTVMDGKGEDVSPQDFAGLVQGLPYGDYSVRLFVSGFKSWARTVHVDQPKIWVTVGMQAGSIEGVMEGCSLSGTVMNYRQAQTPLWVRLIQLYFDESLESEVTSDGSFKISGAQCGNYVLVVMSDNNAIRTEAITLKLATEHLSIRIDNNSAMSVQGEPPVW